MTVRRDGDAGPLGGERTDTANQFAILVRRRVTDSVGDIERRRAGRDRDTEHLAEKLAVGARRIFRRKLHVVDKRPSISDGVTDLREHLASAHA